MRGNILIVGHGRSGKDTAAEFLHGRGSLRYAGSFSWFALPFMAEHLGLPPQLAWERRHQNRKEWFDYCNWLRRDDPLFLARLALKSGNVVTGLRDRVEMDAARASGLFSSILWIHRPGNPVDPTVKFTAADSTDYLVNDGTLPAFEARVLRWAHEKGYL